MSKEDGERTPWARYHRGIETDSESTTRAKLCCSPLESPLAPLVAPASLANIKIAPEYNGYDQVIACHLAQPKNRQQLNVPSSSQSINTSTPNHDARTPPQAITKSLNESKNRVKYFSITGNKRPTQTPYEYPWYKTRFAPISKQNNKTHLFGYFRDQCVSILRVPLNSSPCKQKTNVPDRETEQG